jgi:hypothetical protein
MSTELKTAEPTTAETNDPNVKMEYLQVRARVINFTGQPMTVTGSDLSWGKWMQSPVSTPAHDSSAFASQGRDSSPSGTEGWATWKLGDATIKVTFSSPFSGSNTQSITCTPQGAYKVSAEGTSGNVNSVTYKIQPA